MAGEAGAKTFFCDMWLGGSGQRNALDRTLGLESLDQINSAAVRQAKITDDAIKEIATRGVQRAGDGGCGPYGVAGKFQHALQQMETVLVILHKEDTKRMGPSAALVIAPI
jgi:hypothetical protein